MTYRKSINPGWVTINTDAGHVPNLNVASFAYWIRFEGNKLCGSGLLKGKVMDSWEAEMKAVINALHVLLNNPPPRKITKIIFNRDHDGVDMTRKKRRDPFLTDRLILLAEKLIQQNEFTGSIHSFCEFRHVKGHSRKKDDRSWVNRWCDEQCSAHLRPYREQFKQRSFEAR